MRDQAGRTVQGAELGNRTWSDLRDEGVTARIRGRAGRLTTYDLAEALRSHL